MSRRDRHWGMAAMRHFITTLLILLPTLAQAGIVFQPHLSEYSKLPPGQYTETTFVWTEIKEIYDPSGKEIRVGTPFVPAGASTDAALGLFKSLWIGNIFRDTNVPFLKDHDQFCRLIGVASYQQNTEQIAARSRLFGLQPGSNGLGDLFGLCGVYTHEHLWGPVKANGLFAATVKAPVGRYERDAILNVGTNYWTVIPQFAFHSEIFGRLYVDGTFAYQWNDDNDEPSAGGLTPTRISDWFNMEVNFAYKFSEHWFADLGYSWRRSVGPNHYDQLTVNFEEQPVSPQTACDNTNNGLGTQIISQEQCDNPFADAVFISPRPGPYQDRGVKGKAITAGFYYIYRTSSVLNFRMFYPIEGRGGGFTATYDVCTSQPCNESTSGGVTTTTNLLAVQEAAAVSASPFFEIRFVHLFWAP